MVDLVVGLVLGSIGDLPDLLVVNMKAGRAASAAVCRRCCLGQVVLRCAALRHSLAQMGDDGDAGAEVIELVAGAIGPSATASTPGMVDVLSPSMLQQLLVMEADTQVQIMANKQPTPARRV